MTRAQPHRLSKQPGEWIERDRTIPFNFESRPYEAFAGDTISSALWAHGLRMLGRSFKYHRPRGIFSFANHDVNDLVEDGAVTNVRADVTAPRPGARYAAVNTNGGLDRDRGRFVECFSRCLPVGFYYKAFHTPRRLFPVWERRMRWMAGLGSVNPRTSRAETPKAYDFCDVLVVGAGPAGLCAAIAAGEQGARVIIVDENARPGGSLTYQRASDPSIRARLAGLLGRLGSLKTVRLKTSTQAAGCYADHWVALVDADRLTKVRARSIVIAGGCFEQPAVFHNNDLPGVMLASGAQRLIHRYAVKPFHRAVVLAANDDAYRAAADLLEAGVEIAAIVDLRSPIGSEAAAGLPQQIRIYAGHALCDVRPARGKRGIVAAQICPLDHRGDGRGGRSFEVSCDGVAMSVGWAPADGLINQAAGKMVYNDDLEQFVPQSLPPGMFAAGRVNGLHDLDERLHDGRRAGLAAAAYAGVSSAAVPEELARRGPARSHPYPIFPSGHGKDFIDLDEDVQYKDIKDAVQEGFDSIELIKRYTTLGMGPSQGKLSNMNGVRALARLRGRSIGQIGTTTSRPFYHPVPLSHLAGRSFHPHRLTAIHGRHQQLGAEFMTAGAWLRPACYPLPRQPRDQAIRSEAQRVRQAVGLIDVGTLGKIEVNGPDAAEFIERLYAGRFARMRCGTTRYVLMCDESGVVIDDGVAARLAEDRFYVTATTTGADAVYREMQRWALLWNLDVVLINLTGTYGAMNLAGPLARQVMGALTEIPLDAGSFPYLGVREGRVAGAAARVLRVGFVGEMGYEIHVPYQSAAHVWDAIMEQGAAAGIGPFGVEAQRILRMEKGHIIIGQDTDGLTNPFEARMDWAVKMDKPFFVGQRSLAILKRTPVQRVLVGFMLSQDHAGPIPKECHLVIKDGRITGRVTSVAFSPTLGRILGLAYVGRDQSAIGQRFMIRVDGEEVPAEVVRTPFYDPDNERQSEGSQQARKAPEQPREAAA